MDEDILLGKKHCLFEEIKKALDNLPELEIDELRKSFDRAKLNEVIKTLSKKPKTSTTPNDIFCSDEVVGKYTFSYEKNSITINLSVQGDADLGELIENFQQFCLACGYHPDTIHTYLRD